MKTYHNWIVAHPSLKLVFDWYRATKVELRQARLKCGVASGKHLLILWDPHCEPAMLERYGRMT